MIRHFGIFPDGFDRDNLFYEQKRFLMYLVGGIPSMESWQINIEYQTKLAAIKRLSTVKLTEEEISLAQLHGDSIDELRKNRLTQEKLKQIKELNEKYNVKTDEPSIVSVIEDNTVDEAKTPNTRDPQALWDILQGKGLTDGK